nr:hypothetical protein [Tanacetum cinerariifolium]
MYAIDVEPIPPCLRNNREVHLDYLKNLKESVETLHEIVNEAKVERPLDRSLASACLYTKHSHELLEYKPLTRYQRRNKPNKAVPAGIPTPTDTSMQPVVVSANQLDSNNNWGSNYLTSPSLSVFQMQKYQQSLADVGSETRPPMLETCSYILWASRFRRYINRKRENQKWLNKALDEGPYQFQMFVPSDSTVLKLQTVEDLQGDALLHYVVEIELMNLILLSIPNDIYNSVDACTSAKDMWKKQDEIQTNSEDPLTSAMLLLAQAITQNLSNLTNNCLRTPSNTINQVVIQGDRVNIQSMNSGNAGRNNRHAYVQEEVVEGANETGNVQKTFWNSSSGNTSIVQC